LIFAERGLFAHGSRPESKNKTKKLGPTYISSATYFLANDDGGLLGTRGLARTISRQINVLASRYCWEKK